MKDPLDPYALRPETEPETSNTDLTPVAPFTGEVRFPDGTATPPEDVARARFWEEQHRLAEDRRREASHPRFERDQTAWLAQGSLRNGADGYQIVPGDTRPMSSDAQRRFTLLAMPQEEFDELREETASDLSHAQRFRRSMTPDYAPSAKDDRAALLDSVAAERDRWEAQEDKAYNAAVKQGLDKVLSRTELETESADVPWLPRGLKDSYWRWLENSAFDGFHGATDISDVVFNTTTDLLAPVTYAIHALTNLGHWWNGPELPEPEPEPDIIGPPQPPQDRGRSELRAPFKHSEIVLDTHVVNALAERLGVPPDEAMKEFQHILRKNMSFEERRSRYGEEYIMEAASLLIGLQAAVRVSLAGARKGFTNVGIPGGSDEGTFSGGMFDGGALGIGLHFGHTEAERGEWGQDGFGNEVFMEYKTPLHDVREGEFYLTPVDATIDLLWPAGVFALGRASKYLHRAAKLDRGIRLRPRSHTDMTTGQGVHPTDPGATYHPALASDEAAAAAVDPMFMPTAPEIGPRPRYTPEGAAATPDGIGLGAHPAPSHPETTFLTPNAAARAERVLAHQDEVIEGVSEALVSAEAVIAKARAAAYENAPSLAKKLVDDPIPGKVITYDKAFEEALEILETSARVGQKTSLVKALREDLRLLKSERNRHHYRATLRPTVSRMVENTLYSTGAALLWTDYEAEVLAQQEMEDFQDPQWMRMAMMGVAPMIPALMGTPAGRRMLRRRLRTIKDFEKFGRRPGMLGFSTRPHVELAATEDMRSLGQRLADFDPESHEVLRRLSDAEYGTDVENAGVLRALGEMSATDAARLGEDAPDSTRLIFAIRRVTADGKLQYSYRPSVRNMDEFFAQNTYHGLKPDEIDDIGFVLLNADGAPLRYVSWTEPRYNAALMTETLADQFLGKMPVGMLANQNRQTGSLAGGAVRKGLTPDEAVGAVAAEVSSARAPASTITITTPAGSRVPDEIFGPDGEVIDISGLGPGSHVTAVKVEDSSPRNVGGNVGSDPQSVNPALDAVKAGETKAGTTAAGVNRSAVEDAIHKVAARSEEESSATVRRWSGRKVTKELKALGITQRSNDGYYTQNVTDATGKSLGVRMLDNGLNVVVETQPARNLAKVELDTARPFAGATDPGGAEKAMPKAKAKAVAGDAPPRYDNVHALPERDPVEIEGSGTSRREAKKATAKEKSPWKRVAKGPKDKRVAGQPRRVREDGLKMAFDTKRGWVLLAEDGSELKAYGLEGSVLDQIKKVDRDYPLVTEKTPPRPKVDTPSQDPIGFDDMPDPDELAAMEDMARGIEASPPTPEIRAAAADAKEILAQLRALAEESAGNLEFSGRTPVPTAFGNFRIRGYRLDPNGPTTKAFQFEVQPAAGKPWAVPDGTPPTYATRKEAIEGAQSYRDLRESGHLPDAADPVPPPAATAAAPPAPKAEVPSWETKAAAKESKKRFHDKPTRSTVDGEFFQVGQGNGMFNLYAKDGQVIASGLRGHKEVNRALHAHINPAPPVPDVAPRATATSLAEQQAVKNIPTEDADEFAAATSQTPKEFTATATAAARRNGYDPDNRTLHVIRDPTTQEEDLAWVFLGKLVDYSKKEVVLFDPAGAPTVKYRIKRDAKGKRFLIYEYEPKRTTLRGEDTLDSVGFPTRGVSPRTFVKGDDMAALERARERVYDLASERMDVDQSTLPERFSDLLLRSPKHKTRAAGPGHVKTAFASGREVSRARLLYYKGATEEIHSGQYTDLKDLAADGAGTTIPALKAWAMRNGLVVTESQHLKNQNMSSAQWMWEAAGRSLTDFKPLARVTNAPLARRLTRLLGRDATAHALSEAEQTFFALHVPGSGATTKWPVVLATDAGQGVPSVSVITSKPTAVSTLDTYRHFQIFFKDLMGDSAEAVETFLQNELGVGHLTPGQLASDHGKRLRGNLESQVELFRSGSPHVTTRKIFKTYVTGRSRVTSGYGTSGLDPEMPRVRDQPSGTGPHYWERQPQHQQRLSSSIDDPRAGTPEGNFWDDVAEPIPGREINAPPARSPEYRVATRAGAAPGPRVEAHREVESAVEAFILDEYAAGRMLQPIVESQPPRVRGGKRQGRNFETTAIRSENPRVDDAENFRKLVEAAHEIVATGHGSFSNIAKRLKTSTVRAKDFVDFILYETAAAPAARATPWDVKRKSFRQPDFSSQSGRRPHPGEDMTLQGRELAEHDARLRAFHSEGDEYAFGPDLGYKEELRQGRQALLESSGQPHAPFQEPWSGRSPFLPSRLTSTTSDASQGPTASGLRIGEEPTAARSWQPPPPSQDVQLKLSGGVVAPQWPWGVDATRASLASFVRGPLGDPDDLRLWVIDPTVVAGNRANRNTLLVDNISGQTNSARIFANVRAGEALTLNQARGVDDAQRSAVPVNLQGRTQDSITGAELTDLESAGRGGSGRNGPRRGASYWNSHSADIPNYRGTYGEGPDLGGTGRRGPRVRISAGESSFPAHEARSSSTGLPPPAGPSGRKKQTLPPLTDDEQRAAIFDPAGIDAAKAREWYARNSPDPKYRDVVPPGLEGTPTGRVLGLFRAVASYFQMPKALKESPKAFTKDAWGVARSDFPASLHEASRLRTFTSRTFSPSYGVADAPQSETAHAINRQLGEARMQAERNLNTEIHAAARATGLYRRSLEELEGLFNTMLQQKGESWGVNIIAARESNLIPHISLGATATHRLTAQNMLDVIEESKKILVDDPVKEIEELKRYFARNPDDISELDKYRSQYIPHIVDPVRSIIAQQRMYLEGKISLEFANSRFGSSVDKDTVRAIRQVVGRVADPDSQVAKILNDKGYLELNSPKMDSLMRGIAEDLERTGPGSGASGGGNYPIKPREMPRPRPDVGTLVDGRVVTEKTSRYKDTPTPGAHESGLFDRMDFMHNEMGFRFVSYNPITLLRMESEALSNFLVRARLVKELEERGLIRRTTVADYQRDFNRALVSAGGDPTGMSASVPISLRPDTVPMDVTGHLSDISEVTGWGKTMDKGQNVIFTADPRTAHILQNHFDLGRYKGYLSKASFEESGLRPHGNSSVSGPAQALGKFRKANNLLNMWQLSLSLFHFGTMTFETAISNLQLGMSKFGMASRGGKARLRGSLWSDAADVTHASYQRKLGGYYKDLEKAYRQNLPKDKNGRRRSMTKKDYNHIASFAVTQLATETAAHAVKSVPLVGILRSTSAGKIPTKFRVPLSGGKHFHAPKNRFFYGTRRGPDGKPVKTARSLRGAFQPVDRTLAAAFNKAFKYKEKFGADFSLSGRVHGKAFGWADYSPVGTMMSDLYRGILPSDQFDPTYSMLVGKVASVNGRAAGYRPEYRKIWDNTWRKQWEDSRIRNPNNNFWQAYKSYSGMDAKVTTVGKALKGTTKAVSTTAGIATEFIEDASRFLFETIVPEAKLAAYMDLARFEMMKLGSDINPRVYEHALNRAWDSVDNRFGQMIYDRLFLNRFLRDSLMLIQRAPGWNWGTAREMFGGVGDMIRDPKALMPFSKNTLTPRASYVLSQYAIVGMYGALYQYLATGILPKYDPHLAHPDTPDVLKPVAAFWNNYKNWANPLTGRKINGKWERRKFPTNQNDWLRLTDDYFSHTLEVGSHKLAPTIMLAVEAFSNRTYVGDQIRDADWTDTTDKFAKGVLDTAKHIARGFAPFALSGIYDRFTQHGITPAGAFTEALTGTVPASVAFTHTPAEDIVRLMLIAQSPTGTNTGHDQEVRAAATAFHNAATGALLATDEPKDILATVGSWLGAPVTREDYRRAMEAEKRDLIRLLGPERAKKKIEGIVDVINGRLTNAYDYRRTLSALRDPDPQLVAAFVTVLTPAEYRSIYNDPKTRKAFTRVLTNAQTSARLSNETRPEYSANLLEVVRQAQAREGGPSTHELLTARRKKAVLGNAAADAQARAIAKGR